MLRDNLVELIEPMLNSAGADPLALYIHTRTPASDDRLPCLKNPRPEGAESSLTESASSPFQAEPAQTLDMFAPRKCPIPSFPSVLAILTHFKSDRKARYLVPDSGSKRVQLVRIRFSRPSNLALGIGCNNK